jgi:hypothetical protein
MKRTNMDKFLSWFSYYKSEITWFIVGFLVHAGFDEFSKENYVTGLIDFILAYINYKCYSKS